MLFFRKKKPTLDRAALREAVIECKAGLTALREEYIAEARAQSEALASPRLRSAERLASLVGELDRTAACLAVAVSPRDGNERVRIENGILSALEEIKSGIRKCILNPAAVDSLLAPAVTRLGAWRSLLMRA